MRSPERREVDMSSFATNGLNGFKQSCGISVTDGDGFLRKIKLVLLSGMLFGMAGYYGNPVESVAPLLKPIMLITQSRLMLTGFASNTTEKSGTVKW
jgi:hypothetical protein